MTKPIRSIFLIVLVAVLVGSALQVVAIPAFALRRYIVKVVTTGSWRSRVVTAALFGVAFAPVVSPHPIGEHELLLRKNSANTSARIIS